MKGRPGYFGKNSVTIKPGGRQRRAADQSWTLPREPMSINPALVQRGPPANGWKSLELAAA
jgi:hypothetical protein